MGMTNTEENVQSFTSLRLRLRLFEKKQISQEINCGKSWKGASVKISSVIVSEPTMQFKKKVIDRFAVHGQRALLLGESDPFLADFQEGARCAKFEGVFRLLTFPDWTVSQKIVPMSLVTNFGCTFRSVRRRCTITCFQSRSSRNVVHYFWERKTQKTALVKCTFSHRNYRPYDVRWWSRHHTNSAWQVLPPSFRENKGK